MHSPTDRFCCWYCSHSSVLFGAHEYAVREGSKETIVVHPSEGGTVYKTPTTAVL